MTASCLIETASCAYQTTRSLRQTASSVFQRTGCVFQRTGCVVQRAGWPEQTTSSVMKTTGSVSQRTGLLPKTGPELVLRIAQHFSAGSSDGRRAKSRQGRQDRSAVPCGTLPASRRKPSAEALGYFSPCFLRTLSTNRIGMEETMPIRLFGKARGEKVERDLRARFCRAKCQETRPEVAFHPGLAGNRIGMEETQIPNPKS